MNNVNITKAYSLPGMAIPGSFYDFQFRNGIRLTLSSKVAAELVSAIRSIIDGHALDCIVKDHNCTIHIGCEIDYEEGTIWQLVMVPGQRSSFQNHISFTFTDLEAMSMVDAETWTKLTLAHV